MDWSSVRVRRVVLPTAVVKLTWQAQVDGVDWTIPQTVQALADARVCACRACAACAVSAWVGLARAVEDLDAALTGHPPAGARPWLGVDFLYGGDPFYLGDGGYSRIAWGDREHRVGLTSNSTPRVKALWPVVTRERETLEQRARALEEVLG